VITALFAVLITLPATAVINPARMPMIATTTSISTKVKPRRSVRFVDEIVMIFYSQKFYALCL
jgi:hypothetical protein